MDIIIALGNKLTAKEQECEELNEELYYWVNGEYCDNKCNVVKELDQLKAENDELKGVVEENFLHALEEQDRADKYFKTLTEIKEIAEKQCVCGVDCIDMKQILQKISEVEDE
jgi:hypothetical protein